MTRFELLHAFSRCVRRADARQLTGWRPQHQALKVKLHGQLPDARRIRPGYQPEGSAVDVAIRRLELGVIEDIKPLRPEFEALRFCQPEVLDQRHVEVIQPRAVEEAPVGVAELAEGFGRKQRGVEVGKSGARIGAVKASRREIRHIHVSADAGSAGTQQRIVVLLVEGYRKSCSKTSDSGKLPAAGQPALPGQPVERQGVGVADHEVVGQIERGERLGEKELLTSITRPVC